MTRPPSRPKPQGSQWKERDNSESHQSVCLIGWPQQRMAETKQVTFLGTFPEGQHLSPTAPLQKLNCKICPSTAQLPVHSTSQLTKAEKAAGSSPLPACRFPLCSHHAHGPSSSPCVRHREGNKTGFREMPEHKQQLTTYPDKVSMMSSSSSSFSSCVCCFPIHLFQSVLSKNLCHYQTASMLCLKAVTLDHCEPTSSHTILHQPANGPAIIITTGRKY